MSRNRTGNCCSPSSRGVDSPPGAVIPSTRITDISRRIQALYPSPNDPGTNSGLQNNLVVPRAPKADRDNYDVKVNWNRSSSHQLFAKFSTLQAKVEDLFFLGVTEGGLGDTNNYVATVGHTWTLSPTMLIDGSIGSNWQDQTGQASDFGTRFGSENLRDSRDERSRPTAERHAVLWHRSQHDWKRRDVAPRRAAREELHRHDESQ